MKDLQRITGFSRDQLRDRLGYLQGILGHDATRGPRNAILVGDATLAALDRMKELERGGLGPQVAADQIAQEMRSPNGTNLQVTPQMAPGKPSPTAVTEALERYIASLEDRVKRLEENNDWLKRRLEQAQDQVRAMLPAVSEGRRRMGRLAALRFALIGR